MVAIKHSGADMRPPRRWVSCAATINLTLGLNKRNPEGLGFMSTLHSLTANLRQFIAVLDCVAPVRLQAFKTTIPYRFQQISY
jgi:hypothetical protein